jgi:hypothetical protein
LFFVVSFPPIIISIFSHHLLHIKTHHNYAHNHAYAYSFFILRTEMHAAPTRTKFCQSCPHHMEG